MNDPRFTLTCENGSTTPFYGFAAPTSNTCYVPNQFFDVCLRHRSRGCVRLVAYLIRQTLGWSDAEGRPLRERFSFSYATLIHEAGVGRDSIRAALAEAEKHHFIRCLRRPVAYQSGTTAQVGLYELCWDESGEYRKDPEQFRGFFAGEGNRTYIPNEYFDVVVRQETLAIAKVVGSVIRFSIGFATKWGHRRQHVALSFSDLSRYAILADRSTLSAAIKTAIAKHFLVMIAPGIFDPNAGQTSTAATYAICWIDGSGQSSLPPLNEAVETTNSRKTRPEKFSIADRSENPTGNGRKTRPEKQSENQTGIQITMKNNSLKQQAEAAAGFELLRIEGFDEKSATALSAQFGVERICRQIDWLEKRKIRSNRLGMLRAAIVGDWPAPDPTVKSATLSRKLGRPNSPRGDDQRHESGETNRRRGSTDVDRGVDSALRDLRGRLGI